MPPTKTWKSRERQVASVFGSERTPLSGGNSKQTRSDTLSPHFYIENKYAKRHAVWSLYDETKPKARKETKPPAIALCRKGSPGFMLCIHSDDLQDFIQACIDSGIYQNPERPSTGLDGVQGVPTTPDTLQDGSVQG